jgi:hypothetical protein
MVINDVTWLPHHGPGSTGTMPAQRKSSGQRKLASAMHMKFSQAVLLASIVFSALTATYGKSSVISLMPLSAMLKVLICS